MFSHPGCASPSEGPFAGCSPESTVSVRAGTAALRQGKRPDHLATVFAGADVEATDAARAHFSPYPPSSPSIGLMKDGKLVYLMERKDIETRSSDMIAAELQKAFDTLC